MARINEVLKTRIRNRGVTITIDHVDNNAIVALNGVLLKEIKGPPSETYIENITGRLENGRPNVLVVTLANFGGGGFNPAALSGTVSVGSEEINLGQSSQGTTDQGIFSQTIIILEK